MPWCKDWINAMIWSKSMIVSSVRRYFEWFFIRHRLNSHWSSDSRADLWLAAIELFDICLHPLTHCNCCRRASACSAQWHSAQQPNLIRAVTNYQKLSLNSRHHHQNSILPQTHFYFLQTTDKCLQQAGILEILIGNSTVFPITLVTVWPFQPSNVFWGWD